MLSLLKAFSNPKVLWANYVKPKVFWAVIDQGLFSATNFTLSLFLARWLVPAEYGLYSLLFSMLMLLASFYIALMIEPMLVFGSGRFKDKIPRYFQQLLKAHWLVTLPVMTGFCIFGIGLNLSRTSYYFTLIACAMAFPLILIQWLVRKMCYLRFGTKYAATSGLLYSVIVLFGTLVLRTFDYLNSSTALIVMGLGSVFAAFPIIKKVVLTRAEDIEPPSNIASHHWQYGRWAIINVFVRWISPNIFYILMPINGGLELVAVLKALMLPALPATLLLSSLSPVLIPFFSRNLQQRKNIRINHARNIILLGAIFYWVLCSVFHSTIFTIFYGDNYQQFSNLLIISGFLPIIEVFVLFNSSQLRALEKPNLVLASSLLPSSIVAITAISYLLRDFGIVLPLIVLLVTNIWYATGLAILTKRTKEVGT